MSTPKNLTVEHLGPTVPFTTAGWRDFQADTPFDCVGLSRSQAFTLPESDAIFAETRRRYTAERSER